LAKTTTNKTQIKKLVVDIIRTEHPENVQQLISLIQKNQSFSEKEIADVLVDLESEDQLNFGQNELSKPVAFKNYVLSQNAQWFWATIILAIVTAITVFAPTAFLPLLFLRYGFGVLFLSFLPGYAFIRILFVKKPAALSNLTETVERVAYSIAVSLVLVPLVALLLNYTSWGITLGPLMLILLGITIAFSFIALGWEYHLLKLSKK
jgi:hypothetical protein